MENTTTNGLSVHHKRRTWSKGETRNCEVGSIKVGPLNTKKNTGALVSIIFTPRGLKEWDRRNRNERQRNRRRKLDERRHPEKYGVPGGWYL